MARMVIRRFKVREWVLSVYVVVTLNTYVGRQMVMSNAASRASFLNVQRD